jgi:DNA-binding LytR/AlgR family response regulator
VKVVIIEDEKLSAEHLTMLLKKIDPAIEVVKYMDTVKTAIQAFQEGLNADLIFIDIHLADGNSFEIFTAIQIDIPIIFTTAYDNYAIQAFKQNSIDYLLKPVSLKDIAFSLEKFKKQQQVANKQLIENITSTYLQLNKQYKTRFLVKKGQGIDYVQVKEVHHFETRESLSFLVTANGNRFPIDYTLDQLETMLPPANFFRINRKIILNIVSIEKVDNYFNGRLAIACKLLEGDARIVSRERVNDFKQWLDN